jgi:hypothetical protein
VVPLQLDVTDARHPPRRRAGWHPTSAC